MRLRLPASFGHEQHFQGGLVEVGGRPVQCRRPGVEGGLLKRMKAVIDDGLSLPLPEALKMEIARGSANNSAVTPEAAEESRKGAMARGREQTS